MRPTKDVQFFAIGSPAGHQRCVLVGSARAYATSSWTCECGKGFELRSDLTAHHNLEGMLLASVVRGDSK